MSEVSGGVRPTIDRTLQRSYGRVNGRKLRTGQQNLLEEWLPKVAVQPGSMSLTKLYLTAPSEVWLEIGFGCGEHLAYQAQRNPEKGLIGCEPFTNGVVRLLKSVKDMPLENVRIFHGDARILLEQLPAASLQRIFVLFPDPWPKAKHHKKRLIQSESLSAMARLLVPGGLLRIATDHVAYGEWILEHLTDHAAFVPAGEHAVTATAPEDWCVTRYQEKALAQGRRAQFFDWTRVS